ncbi:MAG: hypothetical protein NZ908_01595 [Candidatus Micrarchaeota archaeon]|nr:hypothetical protein [Candidatus Micrarchaeota archaeon]
MNDFFREAILIDKISKILGSNTRIYEQDLYDSDLRSFWKLVSLSGTQMKYVQSQSNREESKDLEIKTEIGSESQQKPLIQTDVVEHYSKVDAIEEGEWKKLEQKVQNISKNDSNQGSIDSYLEEFNRLKDDVNAEIVRLSSLYRQEPTASKKQAIAEKIKLLKSYRTTGDPNKLVDYLILKLGIGREDGERLRNKILGTEQSSRQSAKVVEHSANSFEPYSVVFDTMKRMSNSSLLLYLMKFDPGTFRKYSLKQIDESQALLRAKEIYLKQKGVPDRLIEKYLKEQQ